MSANDLCDRLGFVRLGRRLGGAFAAAALVAMAMACGGKEAPKPVAAKPVPPKPAEATPVPAPNTMFPGKTTIGEILIKEISQDFGKPQLNLSVEGTPLLIAGKQYASGIGTHANSRARISFPPGYRVFSGACGVDDWVKNGSVSFRILGEGDKVLFRTGVMKGKMPAASFSVNISGLTELTLVVDDGGDGINADHANWVDLALKK